MATTLRWRAAHDSDSSTSPDRESYSSYQTQSTAPTEHTEYSVKPPLVRRGTCDGRVEGSYNTWQDYYDYPRASTETYASTIPSEEDFSDDEDQYDVEELSDDTYRSQAIASTPRDFAELFPSRRRLSIKHDDATLDGNMNLRIDTQVQSRSGRLQPVTLFHLRMRDLKTRDFSLRRYCRDSGREVAHSIRKFQKPLLERPTLQKSFTDAFSSFRHKRSSSAVFSGLKRDDFGFGSVDADAQTLRSGSTEADRSRTPMKVTKLEFANYAHVEVKQRGSGVQRRYCFEYWGQNYTWKRLVRREGTFEEVSYHLFRGDKDDPLAHILPIPLTKEQATEERLKGGWISPCSMWLSDADICDMPDVADVIVSTGLIALVDDSIKRRWHSRHHRQLVLPISPSLRMDMEYVGPRKLIDEVFNRASYSRPLTHRRPSVPVSA